MNDTIVSLTGHGMFCHRLQCHFFTITYFTVFNKNSTLNLSDFFRKVLYKYYYSSSIYISYFYIIQIQNKRTSYKIVYTVKGITMSQNCHINTTKVLKISRYNIYIHHGM